MVTSEMTRCLARLNRDRDGHRGGLQAVDAVEVAAALGVAGVAVSLGSANVAPLVWGEDQVSVGLADLELILGLGPVADAATGVLVLEPDLAAVPVARWPGFVAEASGLGVAAMFAFPLRFGVIRVGVLTLHRATTGSLSTEQLQDALTFADAVTLTLLAENEVRLAEEPDAAGGEETDTCSTGPIPDELGYGAVVAQATGMVSVQLGIRPAEALVRLRAYAYGNSRRVGEVAKDVLDRRLRFDKTQR